MNDCTRLSCTVLGAAALLAACGGGSGSGGATATAAAATAQALSATGSSEAATATIQSARGGYTSAPVITTQPISAAVTAGTSVSFSVVAYGADTLSYQWRKNGTAISGAAAASYTIASAATSDAGSYDVVVSNSKGSATSTAATLAVTGSSTACDTTQVDAVLAAITNFKSALGSTLTAATQYDTSSYSTSQLKVYKTNWSNLPGMARPGLQLSQLTTSAQVTAFNTLVQTALSSSGAADFQGVIAADDYLGYTLNANGYGADLYRVAIIGTPSQAGSWSLMLGGHHLAFNLAFNSACTYPVPHHIGVEPRTSFSANSHTGYKFYSAGTYQVLASKAAAMVGVFSGLSSTQLQGAFLTSQTFSDVLIGPVEYGSGSYGTVQTRFNAVAALSNRGLLVGSLNSTQQALVDAVISQFVGDYDSATAARLLADYKAGYASTYVAWANASGSFSSAGPNVASNGTYMRIDGPRVWIEIVLQNGVIVNSQTHYHMIYRDKSTDYFNQLSS